jgi:hypothetical protein
MVAVNPDLPDLILSVNRALLGEVSCAVRQVDATIEGKIIRLRFVFDGVISDDDKESASCVATEVIADYPDGYKIYQECVQMDAPRKIPSPGEGWRAIFARKESRQ